MTELPDLTADCSECAALCCLALAFDEGEDFAFDKPAGLPCPNLTSDHRCNIYGALRHEGFAGCIRYDCTGAGQRVVQEVFKGQHWRDDPELTVPMIEAFASLRKIHDAIELLTTAAALPLPEDTETEREALLALYAPDLSWTPDRLAAFQVSDTPKRLARFLSSLAALPAARGLGPR